MNQKSKRSGILAVGAFLTATLLLFFLWQSFAPGASGGSKQITIEVVNQAGESTHFSVKTRAEYLKEAAETVLSLEGSESPYGFVLYGINGMTADFRAGTAYWAIYANGEYGNYSIDKQPISDGEAYAFVYETY